ncbi:hypothetical protein [Rhizobium laguerreae]|uniref:hypothetical protein n=1 Tax=Rhizobium laguerreae TaxID=1076926 RepID=UPI001C908F5C|nr:hypothetical protein [Rhizobium laguerreae]MBY3314758.1 hypothetical protein [Rhizobium laguerreae]
MSERRPDFMKQFDIDLETEGFGDFDFDGFTSPIDADDFTEQATRYYSPRAVAVSVADAAEMEAVYRGLLAHYFPDHPTVQ